MALPRLVPNVRRSELLAFILVYSRFKDTNPEGRHVGRTVLITIELLAASIWVGSLVCLAIVAAEAGRALDAGDRVVLFRGIGRRYAIVGTGSLLVAIGAGAAIAGAPSGWSGVTTAALVSAGVLVLLTATGMAQARRMTVSRRRAAVAPDDARAARDVRRGAAMAGALRGTMAVVTVAIVAMVAHQLAG
jgi:hypothetical protein